MYETISGLWAIDPFLACFMVLYLCAMSAAVALLIAAEWITWRTWRIRKARKLNGLY